MSVRTFHSIKLELVTNGLYGMRLYLCSGVTRDMRLYPTVSTLVGHNEF